MPDDPIEGGADASSEAERKLRAKFEQIEEEEARKRAEAELPSFDSDVSRGPSSHDTIKSAPTNDEIRARTFGSPIEGALEELAKRPGDSPEEVRLRQLEMDIEEANARHREEASTMRGEFDEKMHELEARLAKVREEREGKKSKEEKMTVSDAADSRGLGIGLSIAYTFIGMPLFGALAGWLLDRALGTTFLLGALTVIGMALGVFYMIKVMNRSNSQK